MVFTDSRLAINEATGIDDKDLGLFRMSSQPGTCAVEQSHHHLGVDEVLDSRERIKPTVGTVGDESFFTLYCTGESVISQ